MCQLDLFKPSKACSKCKVVKTLDEYHNDKRKAGDGKQAECIACSRIRNANRTRLTKYNQQYHLKTRYNLTTEDYETMLKNQQHSCKICKKEDRLFVDHCHKTGKIRGLLCHGCNAGIGLFFENKENMKQAILYLEENS